MTLVEAIKKLGSVKHPEDVFGPDATFTTFKRVDREWSLATHPDSNKGSKKAEEAFKAYGEWKVKAEFKLAAGTYGDRTAMCEEVKLTAKSGVFTLKHRVAMGDIANVYAATDKAGKDVIVKIGRSPANNDLMANEATQLRWIRDESEAKGMSTLVHVPVLIDSFELQQGRERRRVNVLNHLKGYHTLADVIAQYPGGLDPRDAAWMFRRLLGAMVAAEKAYLVHGAILPSHFMVCCSGEDDHNGVLIDWCYSVKVGSTHDTIKAASPAYLKTHYPPEILAKRPAKVGTDIYMAARVLMDLLGCKMAGPKFVAPPAVPREMVGLMRACLFESLRTRTSSTWELHDDFSDILKKLYGPRKFRAFQMPRKATSSTT
jgi:hypothetical protein